MSLFDVSDEYIFLSWHSRLEALVSHPYSIIPPRNFKDVPVHSF